MYLSILIHGSQLEIVLIKLKMRHILYEYNDSMDKTCTARAVTTLT